MIPLFSHDQAGPTPARTCKVACWIWS